MVPAWPPTLARRELSGRAPLLFSARERASSGWKGDTEVSCLHMRGCLGQLQGRAGNFRPLNRTTALTCSGTFISRSASGTPRQLMFRDSLITWRNAGVPVHAESPQQRFGTRELGVYETRSSGWAAALREGA